MCPLRINTNIIIITTYVLVGQIICFSVLKYAICPIGITAWFDDNRENSFSVLQIHVLRIKSRWWIWSFVVVRGAYICHASFWLFGSLAFNVFMTMNVIYIQYSKIFFPCRWGKNQYTNKVRKCRIPLISGWLLASN